MRGVGWVGVALASEDGRGLYSTDCLGCTYAHSER